MFITKFVWNIHHLAVMDCRDYNSVLIDSSHGNHHGIFHIGISLTLTYSIAYWKNIREQYSLYTTGNTITSYSRGSTKYKLPNKDTLLNLPWTQPGSLFETLSRPYLDPLWDHTWIPSRPGPSLKPHVNLT